MGQHGRHQRNSDRTVQYQLSDDWKTRLTYGWNNDRYSLSIAQPSTLSNSGVLRRGPMAAIMITKRVMPAGTSSASRTFWASNMIC